MTKIKKLKILIGFLSTIYSASAISAQATTDRLICHDANLSGNAGLIVSIRAGLGPVFEDEGNKFKKLVLGESMTLGRIPGGQMQNVKDFFDDKIQSSMQFAFGKRDGSQVDGDGYSPARATYIIDGDESHVVRFILSEVDQTLLASLTETKQGHTMYVLLKCVPKNY